MQMEYNISGYVYTTGTWELSQSFRRLLMQSSEAPKTRRNEALKHRITEAPRWRANVRTVTRGKSFVIFPLNMFVVSRFLLMWVRRIWPPMFIGTVGRMQISSKWNNNEARESDQNMAPLRSNWFTFISQLTRICSKILRDSTSLYRLLPRLPSFTSSKCFLTRFTKIIYLVKCFPNSEMFSRSCFQNDLLYLLVILGPRQPFAIDVLGSITILE